MMSVREAELIFRKFTIPQLASSTASFVTSSAVVIMVVRSRKNGAGLQTPYRRIIFGLSVSDIFQSFAYMTGPWSVQNWLPISWGVGNEFTCRLNGSILTLGMNSVPIYTTLLCLYYLCKLKYRMSNEVFSRRFEYKFHAFIILFNFIVVPTALAMNVFHPTMNRSYCHFSKVPVACGILPDIDCDPVIEKRVSFFNSFLTIFLPLANVCIILIMMVMLYLHAISFNKHFQTEPKKRKKKEKRNTLILSRHSSSAGNDAVMVISSQNAPPDADGDADGEKKCSLFPVKMFKDKGNILAQDTSNNPDLSICCDVDVDVDCESVNAQISASPCHHDLTQQSSEKDSRTDLARDLHRIFKHETLLQVTCYIAAFGITYIPLTTSILLATIGITPSMPLLYLAFGCYPLQGVFNILIYSRPEVASLQRKHPGISWLRSFWLVLRSGGEIPNDVEIVTSPSTRTRRCFLLRCCCKSSVDKENANLPLGDISFEPNSSRVSSLFIGTFQPQVFCAACAVSSRGCVHGLSQSMGNDDLRYNSEAKWRYLEGGETNVLDGIKDVDPITTEDVIDVSADGIQDVESITTADEVNVSDGIQDVESITTSADERNVPDGIHDVEPITTSADEINVSAGIQDVESIATTGNSINDRLPLSSNISLFSDPWQHALKRAREYGHS